MRRTLLRLLAAPAAIVVMGGLPVAAPAQAAAPEARVMLSVASLTVAADSPGKTLIIVAEAAGPDGQPLPAGPFRFTVDTAGVSAFATVSPFAEGTDDVECTTAATVITCTTDGEESPTDVFLPLQVQPKDGAPLGATGKVAVQVQAGDNGPVARREPTITIGEAVDLSVNAAERVTVAPGRTRPLDLTVDNVGERPARGAVLVMSGFPVGLLDKARYRNCGYGRAAVVCTFDEELAVGSTYGLSRPLRVKVPADAAAGSSSTGGLLVLLTPAEWRDARESFEGYFGSVTAGTDAATHLVVRTALADVPQADEDEQDNYAFFGLRVAGKPRVDVAAVGATITGEPGARVATRVGFRNAGPGSLYPTLFDNTDPYTHVVVPAGTTAVAVDERCLPFAQTDGGWQAGDNGDRTGAPEYLCLADRDARVKAGTSVLYDFTFEVGSGARHKAGRVAVFEDELLGDHGVDTTTRNNSAPLAVTEPGTNGSGAGLPITGTQTGPLAVAGALLLLVGAGGMVLLRRRRIRFTA